MAGCAPSRFTLAALLYLSWSATSLGQFVGPTRPEDIKAYNDVAENLRGSTFLNSNGRWKTGDPCADNPLRIVSACDNKTKAITAMTIYGQGIIGTLSESIANMTSLASLTIVNTSMNGSIPSSMASLSSLRFINIAYNNFSGELPRLHKLANLTQIYFPSNFFNGSIFDDTFPPNCTYIDISNNQFTGPLTLTNVGELKSLNIENNDFSGDLPQVLESATVLSTLIAAKNKMTGVLPNLFQYLPTEIDGTATEVILNVANNSFTGSIPQSVFDVFSRFTSIAIDISFNNFSGYVPAAVAASSYLRRDGNPYLCGDGLPAACPQETGKDTTSTGASKRGLLIGVLISLLVVVILILGFIVRRIILSKRRMKTRPAATVSSADGPLQFSHEELVIAARGFHFDTLLGRGGFGNVYKGLLEDGREVAIKVLNRSGTQGQGESEYAAEVNIISMTHHRNLVQLVGFCNEGEHRILVYEYVSNGNLAFHLHEADEKLSWIQRCGIAIGTARALAYLHEDCSPRIVHRDIKPSNILLTDAFQPKIADFGLAKLLPDGVFSMTTRVLGTWGYVAPEYIGEESVSEQVDVFSFGMVLLELISGRSASGDVDLVDLARQSETQNSHDGILDPALKHRYDELQLTVLVNVALQCLDYDPLQRPPMGKVVRMLEETQIGDAETASLSEVFNVDTPVT